MNFFNKSHRKILAVVIVLFIVFLGSWVFLNRSRDRNKIILGPEDNGKSFHVNAKTEIVVELPEKPSTGYEWRIVSEKDSLNLLENKYIPPENQEPGKGGFRRIKFTITSSKNFTMHYTRPWENQVENIFTISLEL